MACTGPDLAAVGIYDAARACEDSEEGRPHSFDVQGATYQQGSGNHGSNRRNVLINACAKAAWHGKLYCIAAGGHMLTLDLPISAAEARFNATMALLSGGITIQGDDPRNWLSAERCDLAKRSMPPLPGPPHIIDLFDKVGTDWAPGLFVRVISTAWDTWWLVGHCNATTATVTKPISASMLPLSGPGAQPLSPADLCVFDVHESRYVGGLSDHDEMVTGSMDATLWRVSRARKYPWVGGCDRHLSEGWWAVKDVIWSSTSLVTGTLAITARTLSTESTIVRILLPAPWKPTESALKSLRVLRVFPALCMCTLELKPATTATARAVPNRLISLNFEHASSGANSRIDRAME